MFGEVTVSLSRSAAEGVVTSIEHEGIIRAEIPNQEPIIDVCMTSLYVLLLSRKRVSAVSRLSGTWLDSVHSVDFIRYSCLLRDSSMDQILIATEDAKAGGK